MTSISNLKAEASLRRLSVFLSVLAVLIVGLMALGAGVRTMNAGLSCPDWPLCFGKVIPDFHVGVWFEFVHRAYAGVVALLFAGSVVWVLRSEAAPAGAKSAAWWGAAFLGLQIVMGGLTVLLLVKAVIVTGHLLLATAFLSCVVWMRLSIQATLQAQTRSAGKIEDADGETSADWGGLQWLRKSILPASLPSLPVALAFPVIVFVQIAIGGLVASTYAGSVCVDWPLCNGVWVPTWKGAIGLQILHRFLAYALVLIFWALAFFSWMRRETTPPAVARAMYWSAGVVTAQTIVGILNLLYFIPPHITVPHQTLALVLLLLQIRTAFWAGSQPTVDLAVRPTSFSKLKVSLGT